MTQEFIFEGTPPERFSIDELRSELGAVAPEVTVVFDGAVNWSDSRHRDGWTGDPEEPWVEDAKLTISNVPDGITRVQVRNFIQNHSASETDTERHIRLTAEGMDRRLNQSTLIPQILARLDALEGA